MITEQHVNHTYSFAEFYLLHKKPEQAMRLFDQLVELNPKKALSYMGIGDVYRFNNNKVKAKQYYQKAVQLATDQADWRLEQFKAKLVGFK